MSSAPPSAAGHGGSSRRRWLIYSAAAGIKRGEQLWPCAFLFICARGTAIYLRPPFIGMLAHRCLFGLAAPPKVPYLVGFSASRLQLLRDLCGGAGPSCSASMTCGASWAVARPMAASWLAPSSCRSSAKPFAEACYASLQGGDFTMNDAPQGNQGRGMALMQDLFSLLTPPSRFVWSCARQTDEG